MDRTDRWFRRVIRSVTRRSLVYTEMIVAQAILRGDRERLLRFDEIEHPIALQLGGDDPVLLAECARIAADWGYDEVNLNVGCPSDRVQKGRIGACLMADPERVAECVAAMRAAVALPVTVKHRIGIDHRDTYEDLLAFVDPVAAAGCDRFVVHARKAWLTGLSPKENREIPPLRYDVVHQLAHDRPDLVVEINGGVRTFAAILAELQLVDSVMVGRAAVDDPWLFAQVDPEIFDVGAPATSPQQAVASLLPWIEAEVAGGTALRWIVRHLHGFFVGRPGAARWRRSLATVATGSPADLRAALAEVAPASTGTILDATMVAPLPYEQVGSSR
jgi:tRNA-dihydrouridine synthase A